MERVTSYRIRENGVTWQWQLLTKDHVVMEQGEETDMVQARVQAILAIIKQHELSPLPN